MALDFAALVAPTHTALVTQEIQRGIVGDLSQLPALAEAARRARVHVVHCTAERRADGLGANSNARLFQYMARTPVKLLPGSAAAEIVPEVPIASGDLVLSRLHGLSPFQGTELDSILRNLGVRTIVGVGVSVNVAIQNLTFDAVNAAYQVVLPRDAVAGFPASYVDAVFEHTLGAVATVCTTDALLKAWEAGR